MLHKFHECLELCAQKDGAKPQKIDVIDVMHHEPEQSELTDMWPRYPVGGTPTGVRPHIGRAAPWSPAVAPPPSFDRASPIHVIPGPVAPQPPASAQPIYDAPPDPVQPQTLLSLAQKSMTVRRAKPEAFAFISSVFDNTYTEHVGEYSKDRKHGKSGTYSKLTPTHAWEVNMEHEDVQSMVQSFQHQQKTAQFDMERALGVDSFSKGPIKTETRLDGLRDKLCLEASSKGGNVAMLFHGTAPEHVPTILRGGVNKNLCEGLFGMGVYFTEDAGKADLYCKPLEDAHADLIRMLYTECGVTLPDPSKEVFLALVCEVVLGLPLHTIDGETTMPEPPTKVGAKAGRSLYSTNMKRSMRAVDGVKPPVYYHSLVAERGPKPPEGLYKVENYREFISYIDDANLLRYIVAYVRE